MLRVTWSVSSHETGKAEIVLVLDRKGNAMQWTTDLTRTALVVHGCSDLEDIRVDLEDSAVLQSVLFLMACIL